ncbi:MAG: iron ABC transporter permease [Alphaproteobacteria bacterium]|nr:iron ABC transporter permease [Alphaproteobacteria bacterium]
MAFRSTQLFLLAFLLAGVFTAALLLGDVPLTRLLADPGAASVILYDIRLPRALLAVCVGGGLAIAGAAMQSYLRNPLAEPSVLGISGGASLAAVIAFYTGLAHAFPLALPLAGILGAGAVGLLLIAINLRFGSSLHLLLGGIAIAALTSALAALALNLTPNPFARIEIVFWLMGSLTDRGMQHLFLMLPFLALGCFVLLRLRPALDALTLGEDVATTLGFSLRRLNLLLVLGVALTVGSGVAVAGSIGFIGLIVPHIVRMMTGRAVSPPRTAAFHVSSEATRGVAAQREQTNRSASLLPSHLLLPSFLGGAIALLLADLGVRAIPTSGEELKLGVLTSLIGAPFFLWLLLKEQHARAVSPPRTAALHVSAESAQREQRKDSTA